MKLREDLVGLALAFTLVAAGTVYQFENDRVHNNLRRYVELSPIEYARERALTNLGGVGRDLAYLLPGKANAKVDLTPQQRIDQAFDALKN